MGKSASGAIVTGGLGVIFGAVVILTSVLFIVDYSDKNVKVGNLTSDTGSDFIDGIIDGVIDDLTANKEKVCDYKIMDEWCLTLDLFIAAGAIGIIAGVIQIGSSFLAWKKKFVGYAGASFFASVACIVSLTIALERNALGQNWMTNEEKARSKAFVGSLIADAIFACAAAVGCFVQSRK